MGYLIKSTVMDAINEDMLTSLMCYDDLPSRDIVKFCYESIQREIDELPQYRVENVVEEKADINKVVEQLEAKVLGLKEQLLYTKNEDMAVRVRCKMHGIDEAIETIKAGGVNE